MSVAEIKAVVENFGEAARRAVESGFDAIEIHGAPEDICLISFFHLTAIKEKMITAVFLKIGPGFRLRSWNASVMSQEKNSRLFIA